MCNSVKVKLKFHLDCKLHFPRARLTVATNALKNVSGSIEAKYWVSWLSFDALTSVNTSYENCLEFVILCSNRYKLKIEMTARQTWTRVEFKRCHHQPSEHHYSTAPCSNSWLLQFRKFRKDQNESSFVPIKHPQFRKNSHLCHLFGHKLLFRRQGTDHFDGQNSCLLPADFY